MVLRDNEICIVVFTRMPLLVAPVLLLIFFSCVHRSACDLLEKLSHLWKIDQLIASAKSKKKHIQKTKTSNKKTVHRRVESTCPRMRLSVHNILTCNCVSILLDDPVICELSFRKWAIKRRSSLRFMPSINDAGTKRSKPNSRLAAGCDERRCRIKKRQQERLVIEREHVFLFNGGWKTSWIGGARKERERERFN